MAMVPAEMLVETLQDAMMLVETLQDAMLGSGWRKILVGLGPRDLSDLDAIIRRAGRGTATTAGQASADVRALGQRRVVILVEPETDAAPLPAAQREGKA
jgi:hypothetical protein